uniref:Uncharacterized protein n=1 Tax=Anguilla anguilla TaxID=7936 RepID=A0A0E9XYS5_ANGAN
MYIPYIHNRNGNIVVCLLVLCLTVNWHGQRPLTR